jgi:transcriptional regulator with XRE-family HTH domain
VIASELPALRSVAERLKWAREHKSWTQDQLSERSKVSRDVIAKTELGITRMPRQIKQLSEALDVPPAWLAFGHEKIDEWNKDILELAQHIHELPEAQRDAVRNLVKQLHQR